MTHALTRFGYPSPSREVAEGWGRDVRASAPTEPALLAGLDLPVADWVPAPASAVRLGFDLPLGKLSSCMRARVIELIDSGAIDAWARCGHTFIRITDLVHFTVGDWEPA